MPKPAVNLDALRAAATPWQFVAGGRTYTARPVSVEQVIAYEGEIVGASAAAILRARRKLLRVAFPWRPSFVWRGDPVDLICESPPGLHAALMADFFASLRSSPLEPQPAMPTPPSSGS